jgi:hypothetical protein
MITAVLTVIGVFVGIFLLVYLAGRGVTSIVMHGLRKIADGIKWILRIDDKKKGGV